MKHSLKIEQKFLHRILTGDKTFEVRVNDRDYQVGDLIEFLPLESDTCNAYEIAPDGIPEYCITYITDYGLMSDFVVFSIKKIEDK